MSDRGLESSLEILFSIPEFNNFYTTYSTKKQLKSKSDFYLLLDEFKGFLQQKRIITEVEALLFKYLKESAEKEIYSKSHEKIFLINELKKPNEDFLLDFNSEFKNLLTHETFFEDVKSRRYKTIKEKNVFFGVDGQKLSSLYEKYKEFNHPYIYDKICEPIIQSKDFTTGIAILNKSLRYCFSNPNFYWHSLYGVEACSSSLFRIQYLLGRDGLNEINKVIPSFNIKILKLIFLYLSRYIYMSNEDICSIDCYSNRANIVRDYKNLFFGIFGLGVNPDIQYLSDKYLAFQTAVKHEMSFEPFKQLMWDSLKMYEHGSHIPNSSGGYKEIEDATWMELVQRGQIRSISLATSILKEFEDNQLNLTNWEIDYICEYAKNKNKDNFENYMNKLNKKK